MAFGFDSRAAMVPGGATEGFGNLGAALLLAPQIHRRDEIELAQAQAQRDFQNRQLAQALQIAQMQDARERQRWGDQTKWHEDEIQRQQANDAARNGVAASNSARQWAGTLGTGALNLGKALGIVSDGKSTTPKRKYGEYTPQLYKTTEIVDPDTGKVIRTQTLNTPDEMDQQRALYDRATLGAALNGQAPAPAVAAPSAVVADRKARNAQVQANQQAAGLAQAPGQPKPPPSTAGVGEVMPSDNGAPPAPAAAPVSSASKPVIPRAILVQKAQKAGVTPEAAQSHFEQLGYQIGD